MAEHTKIEWCDHSWSPWVGCTKVSQACDHCYAESWAKRSGHSELWEGDRRRTSRSYWQNPLKWNREAEAAGKRSRTFPSLCDPFDNQVPSRWRDDFWHRIDQTPWLLWLLLTKRPQNIPKMLPDPRTGVPEWGDGWPNVWLGTTAENQREADRRIPYLRDVPAIRHFVSCEPLLGDINLRDVWRVCCDRPNVSARGEAECCGCPEPGVDWVICGGESGPGARPMQVEWARSLRDQCNAAGVRYFFKQWGEWAPARQVSADLSPYDESRVDRTDQKNLMIRVGKKRAGAMLDGREHKEFPDA